MIDGGLYLYSVREQDSPALETKDRSPVMTLRDWIALQLFRDMISAGQQPPAAPQDDAEDAYIFADEFIKRSRKDARR
jgi:hypothetical protein